MRTRLLPVLLLTALPTGLTGQLPQTAALKGLKEFKVQTSLDGEGVQWTASEELAMTQTLRTRAELALRREGIGVNEDAAHVLWFRFACRVMEGLPLSACSTGVVVGEMVPVRGQVIRAYTYANSVLYPVGHSRIQETFQRFLGEMLNGFLNDYLTANPKGERDQ